MRWILILLFWTAAIFSFTMAVVEQPYFLPGNPSLRIQHVGAFLTLSVLAASAYPRVSLLVLFFLLSMFSGIIELVQLIPSLNRVSDWADFAVDTAVIALTLFFVSNVRRVRANSENR